MRCRIALLAAGLLLAGCQPAYVDGEPNPESPYYSPPTGSVLEIRQPLDVPARSDRVYFQRGDTMPWHEVNQYSAYCALRLENKASEPRRIAPGTYTVREVSTQHLFQLAQADTGVVPVRGVAFDGSDDSREDYQVLAMVLALDGPDQQVEALACADWGLPQVMRRVTLESIGRSLGDHAELRLTED